MEREEIEVGGIYAVGNGYVELFHIHHVTVDRIETQYDTCHCQSDSGEMFVSFLNLEKQIGYDATYSDEYKALSQKIDDAQKAIDACDVLIAFEKSRHGGGFHKDPIAPLEAMKRSYEADCEIWQHGVNQVLEAKSWMTRDKIE